MGGGGGGAKKKISGPGGAAGGERGGGGGEGEAGIDHFSWNINWPFHISRDNKFGISRFRIKNKSPKSRFTRNRKVISQFTANKTSNS